MAIQNLSSLLVSYYFDQNLYRLTSNGYDYLYFDWLKVAAFLFQVYTGIAQAFRHIYITEGMAGYYRGLFAAISHTAPQSALYFGLYHLFKQVSTALEIDHFKGKILV